MKTKWVTDFSIEQNYMANLSLAHRKKYAQFFTPLPIAEFLTQWLLGHPNLQTVQEPAFGLGIFSRLLLSHRHHLTIKAFDIDSKILSAAKKHFTDVPNVKIFTQDYMENDWQNKYDGIVCNPPYFKFHDYNNKALLDLFQNLSFCLFSRLMMAQTSLVRAKWLCRRLR